MSIKILLALGLVITCCLVVTLAQRNIRNPCFEDKPIEISLKDTRYHIRQLKCVLEQGPCDLAGRNMKKLIPKILGTCPECKPEQTLKMKEFDAHMRRRYPKEWLQIRKKYGVVELEEKQS